MSVIRTIFQWIRQRNNLQFVNIMRCPILLLLERRFGQSNYRKILYMKTPKASCTAFFDKYFHAIAHLVQDLLVLGLLIFIKFTSVKMNKYFKIIFKYVLMTLLQFARILLVDGKIGASFTVKLLEKVIKNWKHQYITKRFSNYLGIIFQLTNNKDYRESYHGYSLHFYGFLLQILSQMQRFKIIWMLNNLKGFELFGHPLNRIWELSSFCMWTRAYRFKPTSTYFLLKDILLRLYSFTEWDFPNKILSDCVHIFWPSPNFKKNWKFHICSNLDDNYITEAQLAY